MSRIIPCQKHLFDIPPGIHYFNSAYISPMMRTAKAAAQVGLDRESQPWRIRPFQPITAPSSPEPTRKRTPWLLT